MLSSLHVIIDSQWYVLGITGFISIIHVCTTQQIRILVI